jgi:uncharacterized NAD(P)/FAD-binding protein YdhS
MPDVEFSDETQQLLDRAKAAIADSKQLRDLVRRNFARAEKKLSAMQMRGYAERARVLGKEH